MDQCLNKNSRSWFWSIEFSRRTLFYESVEICFPKCTSHQVCGHHGFVSFKKDFHAVDESIGTANFTLFWTGRGFGELKTTLLLFVFEEKWFCLPWVNKYNIY
eukprot:maker-scaffold_10-snap-gene-3.36-mRNA-1 protein AED:0.00 eAED:0.00 QI:1063/1/1/1/0/0.33/3/227/102